jgi:Uma2 family endonuclease
MSAPHVFTIEEWHQMGTLDAFGEDARVELLDGEVFDMSPIGPRHAACLNRLVRLLVPMLGDDGLVSPGNPVELDDRSEPQPDLAVLRFRADGYEAFHPTPVDVCLLIEVSDSSLPFDRGRKAAAYARTGIREYWIVDLKAEEVIVLRGPGGTGYGSIERYQRGQAVRLDALPQIEIQVADVLAPAT